MADLAKQQTRREAQDRVTKNTDHILPRTRNTEAPAAQVRADMRSAYRPSKSDSVRRALGMATDTVAAYADMKQQEHFENEKAQAQQAMADFSTGKVDPAAQERSKAYSQVISTARARNTAAELEGTAKQTIQSLLADGTHDLDDVNDALDGLFKPHLFNEDGTPKDYGTPDANVALYRELNQTRLDIRAGAQEIIAGQVKAKGLAGVVDTFTLDAKKGVLNVEGSIAQATALGVDAVTAKRELLSAVINTALQTEDPDVILRAADSRKADGTRTWSTAEENTLRDTAIQQRNIFDHKREKEAADRSAATLGATSLKVAQGFKLTPAYIQAQIDSGALRPQDADTMLRVQEHADDERYQRVQRQRQDINWAQSQQDRALALQDRAEARANRASQRAVNDLMIGIYQRGLSPAQAQRSVTTLYASRKITGDTYRVAMGELEGLPGDKSIVSRAGAEDFEFTLNDVFTAAGSKVGQPGYASADDWGNRTRAGQLSFYRALRQGQTPADALRAGLTATQLKPAFVDSVVSQARARSMTPTIKDQTKK